MQGISRQQVGDFPPQHGESDSGRVKLRCPKPLPRDPTLISFPVHTNKNQNEIKIELNYCLEQKEAYSKSKHI